MTQDSSIDLLISNTPVAYEKALAFMETRVAEVRVGQAHQALWLLEHPPLYTAGTSAQPEDLLGRQDFPVYEAGRGGQYTYHGPGQRVGYVMLDLSLRGRDVRQFVRDLEGTIIDTLASFGIPGERRDGRVGIWVVTPEGEKKIAALGIRLRKWVSFHGISINLNPDLSHFGGIVPCGLPQYGVTSLHDLGVKADMTSLDQAFCAAFSRVFGQLSTPQQPGI